jgi:Zn-dependent peptidase ImmA (M78 family)
MVRAKTIKIVEKNIKAYGYAYPEKNLIEISPKQTESQYLDTLIHELLHILNPEECETKVLKDASVIRYHLWKQGYRRK